MGLDDRSVPLVTELAMEDIWGAITYFCLVIAVVTSPWVSVALILLLVFGRWFIDKTQLRARRAFQFRLIDSICLAVWVQLIVAYFVTKFGNRPYRDDYDVAGVLGFSSFFVGIVVVIWWRVVAYLERNEIRGSLRRGVTELIFVPLLFLSATVGSWCVSAFWFHLLQMRFTETPLDDDAHWSNAMLCAMIAILGIPTAVVVLRMFHGWIINEPIKRGTG